MLTLAHFVAIALSFWGATPACGTPTASYASLANVQGVDGPGIQVYGYSDPSTCSITIDAATPSLMNPDHICALVVHEYGHLLGYEHSADPASVMNVDPAVPSACSLAVLMPPTPSVVHHRARAARHHHKHRR